jgi:hypothetical protein
MQDRSIFRTPKELISKPPKPSLRRSDRFVDLPPLATVKGPQNLKPEDKKKWEVPIFSNFPPMCIRFGS